jgi:hypothetical protein
MLSLDATTKSLEVKLAGAVATTELPVVASYVDIDQSTFALTGTSEADETTNGATAVTAVAAPAATTTRKLNYLSVFNVDSAAATVSVQVNNNSTKRIAWKGALAVGDTLVYVDGRGFYVTDASGNFKTAMGGVLPAANFPALTGDVTTAQGSLATTIGANKVTVGMLAQVATMTVLGRSAGGTGDVSALTTLPTGVQDNITRLGTITSGVWNAGAITSSGKIITTDATDATSISTGSLQAAGGLGVTKALWVGGLANINGKVGIGTTGPITKLQVQQGTDDITVPALFLGQGTDGANGYLFGVDGSIDGRMSIFKRASSVTNTTDPMMTFYRLTGNVVLAPTTGNVGIGTTGPGAQLHTTGTVRFANFGAGTATFDASGNISSVSDRRFKDRITPLPYGLAEVCALRPIQHGYNALSGLDRSSLYGGFLAQDVQPVMPLAVGRDNRGYLTLSDRVILGAIVNAIQTHEARLVALEQRMH